MEIKRKLKALKRQTQANHRRQEARRNYMEDLLIKQNHQCRWCGKRIVSLANMDTSSITKIAKKSIFFIENGVEVQVYPATIDHVKPIRDFDVADDTAYNNIDNLVASCATCNRDRTKQYKKIHIKICTECGAEYQYVKRRIASIRNSTKNKCGDCCFDDFCHALILMTART